MKSWATALAAAVVILLALVILNLGNGPSFTPMDRDMLLDKYAGGRFTSDRVYERCENQRLVYYYPDGLRATHERWCWK